MRALSVLFLVCLLHTVQSRVTEVPTSALRPKDELRELVNTRASDRKVTVTAAASLSAEIQTSAIRAVAKLLATCGLGVWSAKQASFCHIHTYMHIHMHVLMHIHIHIHTHVHLCIILCHEMRCDMI